MKEYVLMSPEQLEAAWKEQFNKEVPETVRKLLAFFKGKREEPGATRSGGSGETAGEK